MKTTIYNAHFGEHTRLACSFRRLAEMLRLGGPPRRARVTRALPILLLAAAFGCGGGDDHDHAHHHGDGHGHKAPHGGVLVNVEDEFCHIEFVREPEGNRLQLHVMRFHPKEGPLKISMAQIEVSAKVGGETKAIVFKPTELDGVTATTEPTSLYVAEADWLEAAGAFDGTVTELKIEGKTIKEISFKFTKTE